MCMAILSAFTSTPCPLPSPPALDVPTRPQTLSRYRAQLAFLSGQEAFTTGSHGAGILHSRAALARELNAVASPASLLSDDILSNIFLLACAATPGAPPHAFAIALSHISARFRHVALSTPLLWNRLTLDLPLVHPELWYPGGKWRTVAERTRTCLLDITVRIRPAMALAQAKGTDIPSPEIALYMMSLFKRCRVCVVSGHHTGNSLLPARTREFRFPETDTLRELRMYFTVTKVSSLLLLLSRCTHIEHVHLCDLRVQPEAPPPSPPSTEAATGDRLRSPVPDTLSLPHLTHLRVDVSDSTGFHAHGLFERLVLPSLLHLHLEQVSSASTLLSSAPTSPSFARIRTLQLSAPRTTLAAVLRFLCQMPALRDLRLRCMSLLSASDEEEDEEQMMHSLLPTVPPLRTLVLQYVHPPEPILHFLVSATTAAGPPPVSYNAARRRRQRTLERLEVEGSWNMQGEMKRWLRERLGEEGCVLDSKREESALRVA